MENRAAIPMLAILGLSFTDCTDKPEPANPIVGEWVAIQIDGEKFPMTYQEGPYSAAYGVDMEIEEDLAGDIAFYQEADYAGLHQRTETSSELVVDESEAPKYRIEIAKDFFFGDEGYYDTGYTSIGYTADTGYYGTGGYTSTAGPIDESPSRPIKLPSSPNAAPAEMILNCTLDVDALACEREGEGEPAKIIFKRRPKEDPAGA